MDFTFTEEQETIAKVARQLFEHRATPEHLTELKPALCATTLRLGKLATADLLGCVARQCQWQRPRFLELALFLVEGLERRPVPVYGTSCSAPTPSRGMATTVAAIPP
jgi:hypothetical protein